MTSTLGIWHAFWNAGTSRALGLLEIVPPDIELVERLTREHGLAEMG